LRPAGATHSKQHSEIGALEDGMCHPMTCLTNHCRQTSQSPKLKNLNSHTTSQRHSMSSRRNSPSSLTTVELGSAQHEIFFSENDNSYSRDLREQERPT